MANRIIDQIKTNGKTDPYSRFVGSMPDSKLKSGYLKEVTAFREWIELSFDELYQLGVECFQTVEPSEKLILLDKIAEYCEFVQITKVSEVSGKKYGYGKLKLIKQSILKFYSVNGIKFTIDRSHKLNTITKKTETKLRKPSADELEKLILISTPRLRAAISMSKDSGLRPSDLVGIRYKHVKDGINSFDGFGGFVLTTEKTEKVAMPTFGPETTRYLKNWIVELEAKMGRMLEDEDYIFPQVKDEATRFTKVGANGFDGLINNQIENLGLGHQISANGLRYFFESNLETKLNMNIIKKIQGKAISDSTRSYSKHDIEELLVLYKPAYDALKIEGNNRTQKAEIERLKREVAEFKAGKSGEVEELRQKIDLMMPTFNAAQRVLEERGEWERLRKPPPASGANV